MLEVRLLYANFRGCGDQQAEDEVGVGLDHFKIISKRDHST